ncbi:otoferlin [Dermacentor andersoni]|uniref:otoferlin n=1 Tax=Dermacentor andersoni TaxID=34620 RepID=UPI003B3B2072
MALKLHLHSVSGFKGRGDRLAKATFRGVSHHTKVCDHLEDDAVFNDEFEWPVGRPVEKYEVLEVQVLQHSRYFTNKVLGRYGMVLQRVAEEGYASVEDDVVDDNNKPVANAKIIMEVSYTAPDGSVGAWHAPGLPTNLGSFDDDRQALLDIEQNIANLQRTYAAAAAAQTTPGGGGPAGADGGASMALLQSSSQQHQQQPSYGTSDGGGGGFSDDETRSKQGSVISLFAPTPNKSPDRKRSLPAAMKTLAVALKISKQRPAGDAEERVKLKDAEDVAQYGSTQSLQRRLSDQTLYLLSGGDAAESTMFADEPFAMDTAPYSITTPVVITRPKLRQDITATSALKAQDFQVCVTIIEGRHLAGLNMDPVICVQVGDQKKYTSVKESTNCPYYNEYFVFDFHMAPSMLFDKIVTLTALHNRNIIRSGKVIGSFKLDVGTVFNQPEHQFYHKWAVLTDPDDMTAGPKGYIKCDISVVGKGDTIKPAPKKETDDDDIEGNLLLPDGVPAERQHARFIVRVYRADGLPRVNSGLVANVKRAFSGETRELIDPYVQVSFAGLTGRTTVKKSCCSPVWNEQLAFTEMFPPLCQRIKIQLRDNDAVNDTVVATHFLEMSKIANEGDKGFLPTFGPSFIYLYGSTREKSLFEEHAPLNDGLGEGVMYRGRLLIAVRTEIFDALDMTQSSVELEPTPTVNEASYAKTENFLLFGAILEASMIDRKVGEKPIYFELSIGNSGNTLDGASKWKDDSLDSSSVGGGGGDDERTALLESVVVDPVISHSTSHPVKPVTSDRCYYHLPYGDNKPCLWVKSTWQDYRRRLYNSNMILRVKEKLEAGLADIQEMIRLEKSHTDRRLRGVLEELYTGAERYLNQAKSQGPTGKTRLDKERLKHCQREMDHVRSMARTMKALVTKNSFKEKLRSTYGLLQKMAELVDDPQHSLPDVFVWMISGGKRVAYHRIPARDLIYSIIEEETGKFCGRVQTLFLKPGKKVSQSARWMVQAKLRMYLWLGTTKNKHCVLKGLPEGYVKDVEDIDKGPPSQLHYTEKSTFELRAHMYQARSLIGSDSSGLSDPFARVVFGDQSQTTMVIDETLSPTWDEMLLFPSVTVYGRKEDIKEDPPVVVIEIFDQDKVGKSEFIGRTIARPHVKFEDDTSCQPPSLEWHDLYRGTEPAGELLATFELLRFSPQEEKYDMPELPMPKENVFRSSERGPVYPVPKGIRPTLSTYRIEVLFWGLRELKRVHLMSVDHPRVDVECGGHVLQSSVILNCKKNPNFSTPVKFLDVALPDQETYCPPLTIRVIDCRSFGRFTLVGTHVVNSLHKFLFRPQSRSSSRDQRNRSSSQTSSSLHIDEGVLVDVEADSNILSTKETLITLDYGFRSKKEIKSEANKRKKKMATEDPGHDEENRDWWSRYFASVEQAAKDSSDNNGQPGNNLRAGDDNYDMSSDGESQLSAKDMRKMEKELERLECSHQKDGLDKKKRTFKGASSAVRFAQRLSPKTQRGRIPQDGLIKIYPTELENVPEFNGFREWLHTFELYRGKRSGDDLDDQNRVVGLFKGSLQVYRFPLPKDIQDYTITGADPTYGLFQGLPSNDPIHVLIRVYVVKATDLHPADMNGKADPYIVINLGSKRNSDKENYVSKQLNPVFGKCFEMEATFPQDSLLNVQIYDWDLLGSDDLIGETKIDLENRFYSRHRATCGIPRKYETYGPNQWRDPLRPSQVLAKLCRDTKLDGPHFTPNRVKVGTKTFVFRSDYEDEGGKLTDEHQSLAVLNRWEDVPKVGCPLVPEHVETRALYHPDKPGIEQGKLEMWVDMFPMDMPLPGPHVDISPRKPKSYELRIIIWNTDDVVLEDDAFFTGEKMSDIYVKGWLKGQEDTQCTDIHYRSLTGEGNFNWRFVFPFDYLPAEEKIVISRKESLFSWDETECKIPARLELQVWDADHFSADDFLGAITLDLNRFPRGAKSSKLCSLNMLKAEANVPIISLFKQRRVKGWWPFFVKKENDEMVLTGKVEAELHLLTREEAERNPAGLGRNEPDPLDKPNRPDSSFIWFLNPLKSIRYIVWHQYKWVIIKALIAILLILLLALFFYSVPGYTVKRMLGA